MKIRIASLLLALALPLTAQDAGNSADLDGMFYKAFYLEKGQRDFAGAMALYEQFLTKAPEHKFAAEAAKQQFRLLDATGKTKERDAFKAKYQKLLGAVAAASAPTPAAQERPARGGEGGERPARGEGGRPDMAARMAEVEKQLAAAKEAGNADEVKRLEQQIERMKSMGNRGQGGPGGAGGRGGRGGLTGALMGGKPVAEMSDEEIGQLKSGIEQSSQMIERQRERSPETADKMEKGVADLKKALDAGDKAAAQKALDGLKVMLQSQRGGRGGEAGGRGGEAGGRGGEAGGRGGEAGGRGGEAGGRGGEAGGRGGEAGGRGGEAGGRGGNGGGGGGN